MPRGTSLSKRFHRLDWTVWRNPPTRATRGWGAGICGAWRKRRNPSLFVAWECARDPAGVAVAGRGLVLYVNPELQRLRTLVDAARARLAELETGLTIEKAKGVAMKARLFAWLRERWMASLRRAMPVTPQAHLF